MHKKSNLSHLSNLNRLFGRLALLLSLTHTFQLQAAQDSSDLSPCRCYKVANKQNQDVNKPDCWINTKNCGKEAQVENRWKIGEDFVWCGTPDFNKMTHQSESKLPQCQDTQEAKSKK